MLSLLLAIFLIILGVLGAVLPFLPGPPLAFAGLLVYGIATHFTRVTVTGLIVFGILTVVILLLDIFAPALFARGSKASRLGIIGALLGTVIGMFAFPPLGIFLGPLLGAFIGEYLARSDVASASRTAWASFLGFLFNTILRLVITLAMAAYFVVALLR